MSDETLPEATTPSGPTSGATAAPTSRPESTPTGPALPRTESPAESARLTTDSSAESARPTTDSSTESARRGDESAESAAESVPRETSGDGAPGATNADGTPKRRRRRGSRGGRNRRKPGTGAAAGANGRADADADDDDAVDDEDNAVVVTAEVEIEVDEESVVAQDYTDAAADRGLTTDDVAEVALEEAGISHTPRPRIGDSRPAPKPQIGDSRPASPGNGAGGNGAAATDAATGEPGPKRRRRRGGRGRGRGGNGGNGGTTPVGTAPGGGGGGRARTPQPRRDEVVRADLGVGETPLAALDDDVLERRRGRTRKGRPAGRYLMCVHVLEGGHTHIAVLEGRSLVEHSLATPTGNESIDGNIYLGRVQNVLPGMEAAFVDIGTPKNGVLYRGDVAFDKSDVEGGNKPKIERMLKNGQMITVQVTKNPIAHKGARLTQEVSLAGRFLVMVPGEPDTYGISKRLPDDERKRLRKVLDGIRPSDAGLIVRTAAEGATQDELERDVRRLRNQWDQISALAGSSKQAKLLYQEPDLVLRLIREEFTKEYRGIVIDDRALFEETRGYVEAIAPELADRVEYYDTEEEGLPIFERFHISEQLLKALDRKVWLPSGGSLIIERTEALTVIDVNTGKNVGKSNLEETVFRNNLEAAEEIARQLRLRDIGGIIVIDFVDMEIKANRDETMRVFRDALARDKTRTQAFEMSELGLVEMTRKRISEGLVESFSDTCPTCHGRGFVLDDALLRSMD
ncbi:MAG TPA: Rne/Rng family ribonuclease [Acidimicrobiia bacterium]|jgi:ribonuclease E|nr:Rne/Rng family ribonuclease [Acidimicrobiia bacterium]